jgi:haloalkane dehalogenase
MPLVYREALPVTEPRGTLLCVHGYPESSYMWRHLLEAAADAGWQAVAPDLPGYGDSPYTGDGSWQAHIDALDEFHREQELGEVVLVVHDWGGLIGLRWACEHPQLVRAMVISDTGFFPDGKWHGMAQALRTPGQGEELVTAIDRRGFGELLHGVCPQIDDRAIDEYFKAYADNDRRRGHLELYRSGEFSELENYNLSKVDVPTLVLWGENDVFAPVAGAHRFAKELPQVELNVFEGAGHFVFDERPQETSAAVVAFLERLP